MKKQFLLFLPLLTLTSLSFAVSIQSMNKQQVTQLLQQKTLTTVNLITFNKKLVNNSLTAYFDEKGHVSGQLSNAQNNEPDIDKGTWVVQANGSLCATWQHWNEHKPICVYMYDLNNGILFINQQSNNFESFILKSHIKAGNQLLSYVA